MSQYASAPLASLPQLAYRSRHILEHEFHTVHLQEAEGQGQGQGQGQGWG